VTINQVNFRGGPDSVVGEITIDYAIAGALGFENVVRDVAVPGSSDGLVKNLPVLPPPYAHPTITTRLDLSAFVGTDGTPLFSPIDVIIDFSPAPSATLADVLAMGTPGSSYPVGGVSRALGSVGTVTVSGYQAAPSLIGIAFDALGISLDVFKFQPGYNQCAPAAMANSLQWLEDTIPISIPEPHVPGFGADGSLVGTLDVQTGRSLGTNRQDTASGGVWPMDGKRSYINMTGDLRDKLVVMALPALL